MVLIVHLDKSILFLDYKNILISITSLQQKISMKKKNLRIRKHRKPYGTFCDLLCLIIKNIIMNVYYLNYFVFGN